MKISVVMLTCNGGAELRQVVDVLRKQDVQAEVEYIAVDSGSTDGSGEFLREAGFRVYSIARKDFSFGPTREYAFRCSTGDIIVTQSQDVVPTDQTYLRAITEPIVKGRADVVQGLTREPPGDNRIFIWDRMGVGYFTREGRAFMRKYGNIGLSCTCLAISRKAWEETGFGHTPFCCDKFIQRRLAEKGFRMVCSQGVVAYHGHVYNLRSLIKRCANEGIGWRVAGVKYSIPSFLYDLTVGFARHAKIWIKAVCRRQARDAASIFFFQIRPICILIGNRILKNVIR